MPQLIILYWRDIPSQIIVKQGRTSAKKLLSTRFQEAIDVAAMRSKAHDTETYLNEWRRGDPETVLGDLDEEASKAHIKIERAYDADRLKILASNGGHECATSGVKSVKPQ